MELPPISIFLQNKIKESNLDRKLLAEKTDISYTTVHDLINGYKPFPAFETVIKIANTFDASIDNVLGIKTNNSEGKFSHLSDKDAMINLKEFLHSYLESENLKPSKFSQVIGLNSNTIKRFVNGDTEFLGTNAIYKIATHTGISIDEMIGRTSHSKEKSVSVEQTQNHTLNEKIKKADLSALKNIKSNLKEKVSSETVPLQNSPTKPKSFVERLQQEKANKNQKFKY